MKNYTLILLLSLLLPFGCRHNRSTTTEMQSKYAPYVDVDTITSEKQADINQPSESSTSADSDESLKLNTPLAKWLEKALQDTLSRNEGDPQLDFSKYELHMWDTITGDFDGDGRLETAHCFNYYEEPNTVGYGVSAAGVVFSDTNIPFFIVNQPFIARQLMNERDLMGDYSDEIGFFANGAFSGWGVWVVYSYIDGKWREIVSFSDNFFINDYFNSDPLNRKDLVMLDPNNEDYIIVKEFKTTEDGEFVRKTRSIKIR